MSDSAQMEPLVVLLLGPTASGKTALSLALSERFGGQIVSCDSVAVYRGMDVGSAKPSAAELARVPHHLVDVSTPDQPFTAGDYSRLARQALAQISAARQLPIVTGGTGLYLRALTEGLFAGPQRDEQLRERLTRAQQRRGASWLHRVLVRLDAVSAARIHPNDVPKLIRAIEVALTAQRTLSEVFDDRTVARDPLTGYRLLRVGLNPPRPRLYERINQRCAQMFADGLVEETRQLHELYGDVKALDALGYRQALGVLRGTETLEEAIAQAQQGHRNYAKRQLTWFRREPEVHWFEDFGHAPATLAAVLDLVARNL